MKFLKSLPKRAGHAVVAVVHDKSVQRDARQLAALAVVRLLLAAGASVEVANLVAKLVHG